jgi:tetratricopeptide (TPR) repeat protein
MELRMGTPEPNVIESDEIELLTEAAVEFEEFGGNEGGVATEGDQDGTRGGPAVSEEVDAAEWKAAEAKTDGGGTTLPEVEAVETGEPEVSPDEFRSGAALLADLEQVDFFIEQGLVDDAAAMLDDMEMRVPGNKLVADRRNKLDVLGADASTSQGAVPAQVQGGTAGPTRNLRPKGAASAHPSFTSTSAPERDIDIDTHADMGIMEKTMERYDAAIEHFKAVMVDPKREVFALTMIGECTEALGDSAEAIRCYQDALKRPSATAEEATQLYYQLGNVFHNLGDHSEALYYFERVYKRDANFRDVARRLAEVKSHAASR